MTGASSPVDVSVVIPTFQRPTLLPGALASVLRQEGVGIEVFVVDDCPDGSAAPVVTACGDARVTYLRNPRPTGGYPSVVRNLAWPHARGRYVHFLDDDDIVPAGHYAAVAATFAAHPRVGLVFGRIEPFGNCPPKQMAHERQFFAAAAEDARRCGSLGTRLGFVARTLFGPPMLVTGAGVVRRETLARVGGFDPSIGLGEDIDFFCRVMRAAGACFVDREMLHYRIGSPSLMHDPDPSPAQLAAEQDGQKRIWANYRRQYGVAEFLALAALSRVVLKQFWAADMLSLRPFVQSVRA